MDISHGNDYDLSRVATQNFIFWLVASGYIWYLHLGTPCTVWSRARHSIVNHEKARAKEQLGVRPAVFSARLISLAVECGIYFTLENPWGSLLWKFHPIERLLADPRNILVVFDACMFGAPFRKATAVLTNILELSSLSRRCDGSHRHELLRGSWKVKKGGRWVVENKTTTAGAYSQQLCQSWSEVLARVARSDFCFGRDDEQSAWFENLLHDTAVSRKSALAQKWASGSTSWPGSVKAVSAGEAQRYIKAGVVFGQHSKQEALSRVGKDFDFSYPRAS